MVVLLLFYSSHLRAGVPAMLEMTSESKHPFACSLSVKAHYPPGTDVTSYGKFKVPVLGVRGCYGVLKHNIECTTGAFIDITKLPKTTWGDPVQHIDIRVSCPSVFSGVASLTVDLKGNTLSNSCPKGWLKGCAHFDADSGCTRLRVVGELSPDKKECN